MSAVAMSSSSSISRRLRFGNLFAPPPGSILHGIRCFAAWGGTLVPLGSGSYVHNIQSPAPSLFATAKSRERCSKRPLPYPPSPATARGREISFFPSLVGGQAFWEVGAGGGVAGAGRAIIDPLQGGLDVAHAQPAEGLRLPLRRPVAYHGQLRQRRPLAADQVRQDAACEVGGRHTAAAVAPGGGEPRFPVERHRGHPVPRHADRPAPTVGEAHVSQGRKPLADHSPDGPVDRPVPVLRVFD